MRRAPRGDSPEAVRRTEAKRSPQQPDPHATGKAAPRLRTAFRARHAQSQSFNETWNGWVLVISGRSAFWTAPGDTALRTLVGWNIEIMLMFAIAGIVFYYMVPEERSERIHGLPARWFWASASSAFCALVECVLNIGGLLVWKYPFWNRSLAGIWLIFVFGYFGFFAAIDLVLGMKSVRRRGRGGSGGGSSRGGARETATAAARAATRRKARVIGIIYAVPVVMNVFGFAVMGWRY